MQNIKKLLFYQINNLIINILILTRQNFLDSFLIKWNYLSLEENFNIFISRK
jgi:hypothetical protein